MRNKNYFYLILIILCEGCAYLSIKDQDNANWILINSVVDYQSYLRANDELKCDRTLSPEDLRKNEIKISLGPGDKILKLERGNLSYVKKVCFRNPINSITIYGKHMGGGLGKSFHTFPVFFAYDQNLEVKGSLQFWVTKFFGDLAFEFNSEKSFNSLIIALNTDDIHQNMSYKFNECNKGQRQTCGFRNFSNYRTRIKVMCG